MAYAAVIDFIVVTVLLVLWPMHTIAEMTKRWTRTVQKCRIKAACTEIYWKLINFCSFLMFEYLFRWQKRLSIWLVVHYCYIVDRVCSSEYVFMKRFVKVLIWNIWDKCDNHQTLCVYGFWRVHHERLLPMRTFGLLTLPKVILEGNCSGHKFR